MKVAVLLLLFGLAFGQIYKEKRFFLGNNCTGTLIEISVENNPSLFTNDTDCQGVCKQEFDGFFSFKVEFY
jgi:hypothetical protein